MLMGQRMKRFIGFIIGFLVGWILFAPLRAKADINYNLLLNWSYQPPNVQQNLVNQNTNIQVVDELHYRSPVLADTYGYTTTHVIPGINYVTNIDVVLEEGCEFALTHEVGHCLANANRIYQWWCFRPEFIQIWQNERHNCVLLYQGEDDIREYFATAYDAYIRFPQLLKYACPDTYNYIRLVLRYT